MFLNLSGTNFLKTLGSQGAVPCLLLYTLLYFSTLSIKYGVNLRPFKNLFHTEGIYS